MDDQSIVQLYWDRDDRAIAATSEKYGKYCAAIAWNILGNNEEVEECLNDTWLRAWNAMPTHWPKQLPTFLGKITRNLSFNRYRNGRAEKRGSGQVAEVLDELAECVSDRDTVDAAIDRQELAKAVSDFVRGLPEKKRGAFVRRYWYAQSIAEIAADLGMPQASVSKMLERTRKQLRAYLTERGFEL